MTYRNSERKTTWKTEYLCTICAFANTYGGTLTVGQTGDLTPDEAERLSGKICYEISEKLGILPRVRSVVKDSTAYVTIDIKPSPDLISYNGGFYRRVGDKDIKLIGKELENFILIRDRRARVGLPIPEAVPADLDDASIELFCKLADLKRNSNENIMRELNLICDDSLNGFSILLFHKNPSRFILASDIRIGRFSSSGKMEDMDTVSGPVFLQPSKTLDILLEKYLIGCDYPVNALKEAIINAVAHKDYSAGDPIRIRIRDNSISVSNPNWLNEKTFTNELEGISKPANPIISDIFFKAGKMRLMGTGISEMKSACLKFGLIPPVIETTEDKFKITFYLLSDGRGNKEELFGKVLAHEKQKSYADTSDAADETSSRTPEVRKTSFLYAEGPEDSEIKK